MIILLSLSFAMIVAAVVALETIIGDAKVEKKLLPDPYGGYILLDRYGNRIEGGDYVRSEDISDNIKHAFIAIEDKRFYAHHGVDLYRVAGAAIKDAKTRKLTEGGSTITCQLVKNTHLNSEKTIKRKIKEAKIAVEMENLYSKDEILEMYLNIIYFGKGIYGVKNACRALYGKSPADVTPIEAASLAATVANPSKYSPLLSYEKNASRTRLVLSLMNKQGYISEEEYKFYSTSNIIINYNEIHNNYNKVYNNSALFECNVILSNVEKTIQRPLLIRTYFDPSIQQAAQDAIVNRVNHSTKNRPIVELMIAENATRGIAAYASNDPKSFLRKRQPGSLIKPFIYASAIKAGKIIPSSPLFDAPTDFNGYSPANYRNEYYGWIDAKTALSKSVNTVSVSLLQKVGVQNVAEEIEKAGIRLDKKDINLALALGGTTYGSSAKEIAEGYLTLANDGLHQSAHFIDSITDAKGRVIYKRIDLATPVYSAETSYLVTDMLKECAKSGTAKQLFYLNADIAAKTGTVAMGEGNADAWCAGYTTKHTFVCHFSGKDPFTPLDSSITGGNDPTKCVRSALRRIYTEEKPTPFTLPIGLKKIAVDRSIKEELHLLVPFEKSGYGESETVYTTKDFTFDSIDPESLFLGDISIKKVEKEIKIAFSRKEGISYETRINGKPCEEKADGFYTKYPLFPLVKVEIYCKKQDKLLYKKAKILRVDQRRISSTPAMASSIKVS